ncbi:unnamed protein product [Auanema sp. JU1783]|nr:unnamed protein product [Auanema sp. JU1783]
MGCAPSCTPSIGVSNNVNNKKEEIFSEFAPPPPIPLSIGSGVRKMLNKDKSIIFIFGGPGSQKGIIIEELRRRYDFVTISTDDIIFNYLPTKVANTVEKPSEIINMLKNDAGVLSLDWIFSMISAKLSTSYLQRFIIDVIPEISSIMRSDCFLNSNNFRALENFERRNPVMFALELNVFDDEILEQTTTTNKNKKEPELSKELNNFMQGMDDIDKGRLQKRLEAYHRCSSPFIRYFAQTKRIIRLTLNGKTKNAASTVTDILRDFGFTYQRQTHRILLFAMKEHLFNDIDLEYYRLRKIRLGDIVKDKSVDVIEQIHSLQQFLERTAASDENFAISLDSIRRPEEKVNKRIMFYDRVSAYLDQFIQNRSTLRAPTHRERVQVHVISSPGDQILLFMDPFHEKVLRAIGAAYNTLQNDCRATPSPAPSVHPEES